MDEHHSWYNGSVWHIDWPYQVYVGQCPTFYGQAILLHILKTIWWRNIVIWIMDQCDSKINLVKYVGQWPIFHGSWFALYHSHRLLKLFLYIKKWRRPRVFVSLRALALVSIQSFSRFGQILRTFWSLLSQCSSIVRSFGPLDYSTVLL